MSDILNADDWFCERGDFWGTIKQLCLCAKCGKSEAKRYDEPRHYRGIFTPKLHMICDECFDALPDASAMSAGTAATTQIGAGLQPASAVAKPDAQSPSSFKMGG